MTSVNTDDDLIAAMTLLLSQGQAGQADYRTLDGATETYNEMPFPDRTVSVDEIGAPHRIVPAGRLRPTEVLENDAPQPTSVLGQRDTFSIQYVRGLQQQYADRQTSYYGNFNRLQDTQTRVDRPDPLREYLKARELPSTLNPESHQSLTYDYMVPERAPYEPFSDRLPPKEITRLPEKALALAPWAPAPSTSVGFDNFARSEQVFADPKATQWSRGWYESDQRNPVPDAGILMGQQAGFTPQMFLRFKPESFTLEDTREKNPGPAGMVPEATTLFREADYSQHVAIRLAPQEAPGWEHATNVNPLSGGDYPMDRISTRAGRDVGLAAFEAGHLEKQTQARQAFTVPVLPGSDRPPPSVNLPIDQRPNPALVDLASADAQARIGILASNPYVVGRG